MRETGIEKIKTKKVERVVEKEEGREREEEKWKKTTQEKVKGIRMVGVRYEKGAGTVWYGKSE